MTVIINGTSGITDVNGTAAAPAITGTDTDTGVFFGTNTVSLSTGGTERLQVDSSGNLGLGVTPSAWASPFKAIQGGGGGYSSYFAFQSNAYACKTGVNHYYNGSNYVYAANAAAARFDINENNFAWNIAGSGTAGNAISFTQAMTLDASGNLGTNGQTSPGTFQNAGITIGTGATNYGVNIYSSSSANGDICFAKASSGTGLYNGMIRYSHSSDYMSFWTASTERARIDSSGRFFVGRTSTRSNEFASFTGSPNDGGWTVEVLNTRSTGTLNGVLAYFPNSAPNNTTSLFFQGTDGTSRFEVRSNGGIANYSANNVNLSDSREKTNANPAGDYLAKICAIPVRTYNYIDQNLEEDDGLTLGVYAQDVQAVAPELVTESNWGTEEQPKMRLSIYQTDMQYALMKCIQEMKTIIDQQAARITALEQA